MPTHPYQAGVNRILKSSPACRPRFCLIKYIHEHEEWTRKVFFAIQNKIWKLSSRTAVTWHTTDILAYVTFTISFSVIVFSSKFSCWYTSRKVSHSAKYNMTPILKFL